MPSLAASFLSDELFLALTAFPDAWADFTRCHCLALVTVSSGVARMPARAREDRQRTSFRCSEMICARSRATSLAIYPDT